MPADGRRLFALNESHSELRAHAARLVAGELLEADFREAGACAVVIRRLSDGTYMDVSGPYPGVVEAQRSAHQIQDDFALESDGEDYFVEIRPLFPPST